MRRRSSSPRSDGITASRRRWKRKRSRDDPGNATPRSVSRGGEVSPEGDVVADVNHVGKYAAMLDSLESTPNLDPAKGRTGQNIHGGGEATG